LTKANFCKNNTEYEALAKEAAKNGIIIQANTGRIAQAERQCFNALIQGAAGTLTKKAMIDIFNDEQLRAWDTHLIVTVHDEVLVECKEEYADLVEQRLPEIMINAAKELGIEAPSMKCDPYNVSRWYADNAAAAILKEYNKAMEKGMSAEEALKKVIMAHIEIPKTAIINTIETGCDLNF
jgi:DNA polymerase I-like protein with 3'-5' exonuclease and polymerase domains